MPSEAVSKYIIVGIILPAFLPQITEGERIVMDSTDEDCYHLIYRN
jgi:hypothetical protein